MDAERFEEWVKRWTTRRGVLGLVGATAFSGFMGLAGARPTAAKHHKKKPKKVHCDPGHTRCGKTCCKLGQICAGAEGCIYNTRGCLLTDNSCAGLPSIACPFGDGQCYLTSDQGGDFPVCLASTTCSSKLGPGRSCLSDRDCAAGAACLAIKNPSGGACCSQVEGFRKMCVIFA
jgi:hypothetical protein